MVEPVPEPGEGVKRLKRVKEKAGVVTPDPPPSLVEVAPEPPTRMLSATFGGLCDLLEVTELAKPITDGKPLEVNELDGQVYLGRVRIDDNAISLIRRRIEQKHRTVTGKALCFNPDDIWRATALVASGHTFHPIREYLEGLVWDGTERISHLPEDILNAKGTAIEKAIIKRTLLSAVARAMRPGVKADCMPVFIGNQGVKKSSFFKALAGPQWFSDTPMDLTNKDSYLQAEGVWLYEWGELETMARAARIGTVKTFLSSTADNFRRPFAKATVKVQRSCIIVGSTNEPEFLVDSESRRFWPLQVGSRIELDLLVAQRDQLWAEALTLWRAEEQHHLTDEEVELLKPVHERHKVYDPWEGPIIDYLKERYPGPLLTTAELLTKAIDKPQRQWERRDDDRVSRIMGGLGYEKGRPGGRADRRRGWVLPARTQLNEGSGYAVGTVNDN